MVMFYGTEFFVLKIVHKPDGALYVKIRKWDCLE